jgi:peptidyl-prolyl cis-trans isomerase B (cyclophilin B)
MAAAAIVALSACGSTSSSSGSVAATSAPTTSPASAPAGSVNCDYVPDGAAAKQVDAPPAIEPATGTASATIELTGGTVGIDLDRPATPCTVGSFVHLAQAGYFDDTQCHRITASASLAVLQCGDPSGTGGGGPGYSFADETSPDMVYPAGTVAMANAGPDTNGSQFFLVYEDSMLPPDYTVFGTVTEGLDVLQGIAAKGITGGGRDGAPVDPVTISSVTVTG